MGTRIRRVVRIAVIVSVCRDSERKHVGKVKSQREVMEGCMRGDVPMARCDACPKRPMQ